MNIFDMEKGPNPLSQVGVGRVVQQNVDQAGLRGGEGGIRRCVICKALIGQLLPQANSKSGIDEHLHVQNLKDVVMSQNTNITNHCKFCILQ